MTCLLDGSFPAHESRRAVVKSHLLGDTQLTEMVSGAGAPISGALDESAGPEGQSALSFHGQFGVILCKLVKILHSNL